jgi:hypothetical protein
VMTRKVFFILPFIQNLLVEIHDTRGESIASSVS